MGVGCIYEEVYKKKPHTMFNVFGGALEIYHLLQFVLFDRDIPTDLNTTIIFHCGSKLL